MDPRYQQLAAGLTGFSTNLGKEDKVLIVAHEVPDAMIVALIRAVRNCGAIPFVQTSHARINRELVRACEPEQLATNARIELERIQAMDAFIALSGGNNAFELADVPSAKLQQTIKAMKPVLDWRVKNTKWVILRWPTPSMAQQALQSTEAFEDFYFRVCTVDYARMVPGMQALKALMETTDQVHITGPETDLWFSLKGMPAIPCGGTHNIPDGEVFSAPVKDSVEGEIRYNAPSIYQGRAFDQVRFVFKRGKIIAAEAQGETDKLQSLLDSDEGARYIGEFALGFNPHINEPMRDILFDEKIAGSFHLTPGEAYEEADNGNRSQVHWDLVCIQRAEYGGGAIYFDGELIRKDGLFVPEALQKLNPEALLRA